MKLLSGIKRIYNKFILFTKKVVSSFLKAINFKRKYLYKYALYGIICIFSCSFLSSGVKTLSVSQSDYISFNIENICQKNNSNIINYSFFTEASEMPLCNKFVSKNFGLEVGPYSLNHSIYCYAKMISSPSGCVLDETGNILNESELIFISDLGYFFETNAYLVQHSLYYSGVIRVSVSQELAKKILNVEEEVDCQDLAKLASNVSFRFSYGNEIKQCVIYSIFSKTNSDFQKSFSSDLICFHDSEVSISNFSRIITIPCGKYRNSLIIQKIFDSGFDFSVFVQNNNGEVEKIDIVNLLDEITTAKTVFAYLTGLSIVLFFGCCFLLFKTNKLAYSTLVFSFLFCILIEIIRFILIRFKIKSFIVFSLSSLYTIISLLIMFLIVFLSGKVAYIHEKRN